MSGDGVVSLDLEFGCSLLRVVELCVQRVQMADIGEFHSIEGSFQVLK
jgi:hypothetical protein